ncbi:hypothetical protein RHMOL_Rhmol13G0251500 [Rhododendron molle]|uniref:Uncharacterized protein n=1 Tax=Rhododendron molle TaxID=49168 RepID=A0ACC0LAH3_RHOML|nr:hypothetical protein RHMOL_Rhmol13G0251500 [Rhododendron molle]
MDGRFSSNPFINEQEDPENSPEDSCDSPRYGKTSPSSHQKSRRVVKKKVVSVPMRDVEGSRLKGETPPPSDSWAWRKYGQKPIKGSPYPRGYYRCSSSKGCPARKQVERSRVDPTMLVVTYSSDHNHPPPASKNNHHNRNGQLTVAATAVDVETTAISATTVSNSDEENNPTVFDLGDESLVSTFGFKWFSESESMSSTMLDSMVDDRDGSRDDVGAVILSMREEDELLFADLGELPECSAVFRRAALAMEEEERRRCSLAPVCGTTR